jgi:hypothetical protein
MADLEGALPADPVGSVLGTSDYPVATLHPSPSIGLGTRPGCILLSLIYSGLKTTTPSGGIFNSMDAGRP